MKKILEAWGRWTVRYSGSILFVSAVLCAGALIAALSLGVDTDLANLLPPSNLVARSYTEIVEEFSTGSVLIVVVQGPDRATVVKAAEDFSRRLSTEEGTADYVASVQLKPDKEFSLRWGLLLQEEEELHDMERLLAKTHLLPSLKAANDLIEEKLADGSDEEVEGAKGEYASLATMSRFGLFASSLEGALLTRDTEAAAEQLADIWLLGEEYFLDPRGSMVVLSVRPSFSLGERASLSALSAGATTLGASIASTLPGVSFAFTGDVENEAAEERAIGADMIYPSILAIVLISALFALSFSRWRAMIFALIALLAGILLDLGFAALTIRNMNMITSSFGVLLVGLGIDFGIHIVSRYDDEAGQGFPAEQVMGRVFTMVGIPILIGALTTAMAFYSLLLSRTLAFRQFGLVAGTGILTTLFSSFTVLPALLARFPPKISGKERRKTLSFSLVGRLALMARQRRIPVITAAAVLVALSLIFIPRNAFEYDLRRIGPQGTPAQAAERLVTENFGLSPWQNLAMASSLEEARSLHRSFEELPLVRRVESLADYIPPENEQIRRLALIKLIAAMDRTPEYDPWDEARTEALLEEIQRLEWNMIELGDLAAVSLGEGSLPLRKRDAMIRELRGNETLAEGAEVFQKLIKSIRSLPPDTVSKRLGELDEAFARILGRKVDILSAVDRPLVLADLPPGLKSDFMSADGTRFLVVIQGDPKLDDDKDLVRLAEELASVYPSTTGTLSLGVELSREVLVEAGRAAVIVAILVMGVMVAGLRSFRLALVGWAAFFAALVWTFGIHPLLGKFNIVNALALPLIMGIGIDYCVHIIAAISSADSDSELHRTGKAVSLSAFTTIIGFGSLALAGSFEGIAALGRTLSTGIFFCYLGAIVLVPALMRLRKLATEEEKK